MRRRQISKPIIGDLRTTAAGLSDTLIGFSINFIGIKMFCLSLSNVTRAMETVGKHLLLFQYGGARFEGNFVSLCVANEFLATKAGSCTWGIT